MNNKKAIVVGAGIVGLATARALALKGYSVEVFERTHKASGASVRNFGMVWPIGQPDGKPYERATRSKNIWKEIADDGRLWYDPVGSLHLAHSKDEWQVLNELHDVFKAQGRDVTLLNKEQALDKSPITNETNCFGGLYSSEEMIVDPREAIAFLPNYLTETFGVKFHWGRAVTSVCPETVFTGKETHEAGLIFICSGADFETLYPEEFAKHPLTKCKLQMMRFAEEGTPRIGPSICGGLSLIHYKSFEVAPSLDGLRKRYKEEMAELLQWGIHVMVSQNHLGHLTIGDSHEYGLAPDPFDRKHINDLILQYLNQFATLRNATLIESWNGVYGKFTSNQTELFYAPEPGVYIMNGVGGTGMTLSFGLAEELIGTIM